MATPQDQGSLDEPLSEVDEADEAELHEQARQLLAEREREREDAQQTQISQAPRRRTYPTEERPGVPKQR